MSRHNDCTRIHKWFCSRIIIIATLSVLPSIEAFSSIGLSQTSRDQALYRFRPRSTHGTIFVGIKHTHRPSQDLIRRQSVAVPVGSSILEGYDPLETANGIVPETKPLPKSLLFYVTFVVRHMAQNRRDRALREMQKGRKRAMWKALNEQRKNIVTLAGYTSHIVFPSFLFLFLGALAASISPLYWSKCIQCVTTLSGTREQLMQAILGLGLVSSLESLFTGLRGSLFWIGGECLWGIFCF